MLSLLVESKNEYTMQLINILTPLIYEGILSIYKVAEKVSSDNDVLKNFQTCLKAILKWSSEDIDRETIRIIDSTKSYPWLENLIRATIKSNIVVLMHNPTMKSQMSIDPKFYKEIRINDFIHQTYIECAREFWNNPFLLYQNYPPIEIKRNQRDSINIIKDCIKESIRKLLPIKHLLEAYLGEEMHIHNTTEFDKISEGVEKNLTKMINRDLELDFKPKYSEKPMKSESKTSATIRTKIADIIQKDDKDFIHSVNNSNKRETENINKNFTKNTEHNTVTDDKKKDFDKKVEKLVRELNDTNSETSLNYNPESNYHEVFSNSNEINNSISSGLKIKSQDEKQKIFNQYLKI